MKSHSKLLFLILTFGFIHSGMSGIRMITPLLALHQGFSVSQVSLVFSLFAIAQIFVALPAGHYIDTHGYKRPMHLAIFGVALGIGIALCYNTLPLLLTISLAALLTGGCVGMTAIAVQRHVGFVTTSTAHVKQAYSWLSVAPAISNFISPLIMGLCIDFKGFQFALITLFISPISALLLIMALAHVESSRSLPKNCPPKYDHKGTPNPSEKTTTSPNTALLSEPAKNKIPLLDLLKIKYLSRVLGINLLVSMGWDVHVIMVPILGHYLHFSAATIGMLLGACAVASASVRMILPKFMHLTCERNVICFTMCITAIIFFIYPWLKWMPWMMLCSIGIGLALGCVQPMVMSLLYQISPEYAHGKVIGLRLVAVNISSISMPLMFGAIGAFAGIATIFVSVGASLLIGAGFSRWLPVYK